MTISDEHINSIVKQVVEKVKDDAKDHGINISDNGVFNSMDQAIKAAKKSQKELLALGLEKRNEMIAAMRKTALLHAEMLAEMAVSETGLGRYDDKVKKNVLAAEKTPGTEDLIPRTYTGDKGFTLIENAPFGVIGSITPTTNPAATLISNSIGMIAAGNSAVFNPHPAAKKVSNQVVKLLNIAITECGGPENLLCSVANPSIPSAQELMKHPDIRLLMVTGGEGVVNAALQSGKKVIAAGPGNPPVIVDDTADIKNAAKCIVDGAAFDNNILCIAEKEVFVFNNVALKLKEEMKSNGAYEVDSLKAGQLVKLLFEDPKGELPMVNKDFVGKDARYILEQIGIHVGDEVKLIIAEVPFEHPFVMGEMLMPVLPIVRVDNLDEAIRMALIAEHGFRHTAVMHSENVVNMSKVARALETTIFVKNASSFAGLGFGGEGYATLSIAGSTGEGLTSAKSFTRQRRCVLADSFRII